MQHRYVFRTCREALHEPLLPPMKTRVGSAVLQPLLASAAGIIVAATGFGGSIDGRLPEQQPGVR
jgi:hypothetical protein